MEKVTIGKREFDPAMPRGTAKRELLTAATQNAPRACAAALGLVCGDKLDRMLAQNGHPKVTYRACGFDALAYGGELLDALEGLGVDPSQVIEQGAAALSWIADSVISEKEVADRVGNSEPPTVG